MLSFLFYYVNLPKSYIFIQENLKMSPDSKVHGANMGPIWGRHDPGGAQVGPMNSSGRWRPFCLGLHVLTF